MSDVAKPDAQNAITHRNVDFLMRWHSFIQSPHSIIQPEGLKKKKKRSTIQSAECGGPDGKPREARREAKQSRGKAEQSRAGQSGQGPAERARVPPGGGGWWCSGRGSLVLCTEEVRTPKASLIGELTLLF